MKWVTRGKAIQLDGKDFRISYLPNAKNIMGFGFFSGDTDTETAIVIDDQQKADKYGRYLILNGDYRKKYEQVFSQGLEACIDVFKENIAEVSS